MPRKKGSAMNTRIYKNKSGNSHNNTKRNIRPSNFNTGDNLNLEGINGMTNENRERLQTDMFFAMHGRPSPELINPHPSSYVINNNPLFMNTRRVMRRELSRRGIFTHLHSNDVMNIVDKKIKNRPELLPFRNKLIQNAIYHQMKNMVNSTARTYPYTLRNSHNKTNKRNFNANNMEKPTGNHPPSIENQLKKLGNGR